MSQRAIHDGGKKINSAHSNDTFDYYEVLIGKAEKPKTLKTIGITSI